MLLAAMAKVPATFFIAVFKVSFDAVTSMPVCKEDGRNPLLQVLLRSVLKNKMH